MKYFHWPFVLFFLATAQTGNGQGCSDAGFCTINSFKPQADAIAGSKMNNQVKLGIGIGGADNNVSIVSSQLEYNRQLNNDFGFDVKLTFLSQESSLASSSGLADVFLSTHYRASHNAQFTLGVKVPLLDGNEMMNGMPLPMDFQPSLGTTDLILGFSTSVQKLQLTTAWQQPISQNSNRFLAESYPANSPFRQFQSTNNYERKGDVLLRVSYPVTETKNWRITPSLLPIYHLGDDEFTDNSGKIQSIKGSQGLTLNGNIFVEYAFDRSNKLELSFGAPFVNRTTRPDGLTRDYVVALEYKYLF